VTRLGFSTVHAERGATKCIGSARLGAIDSASAPLTARRGEGRSAPATARTQVVTAGVVPG